MSAAPHNRAKTGNSDTTSRRQTDIGPTADAEALSLALDGCRQQHQALMLQNAELLGIRSLLSERVASLELALAEANQFAHYDQLTGLPNRRLLLDRFNQASALANRHDQGVAVLFFDLNDFKSVNDNLGHEAGDRLLQQVAERLTKAVRKSDTACRYGGDEFVVLLTEIDHQDRAVQVLDKICTELAPSYDIDRYSIPLAVSHGMAIYPQDAQNFTDLMRLSDRSMFRNKSVSHNESVGGDKLHAWLHGAGQNLCRD